MPSPLLLAYPAPNIETDRAYLQGLITGPLAPWVEKVNGRLLSVNATRPNSDKNIQAATAILGWNQGALVSAPRAVTSKAIHIDPYMDISATDTLNRWVASQLNEPLTIQDNWQDSIATLRKLRGDRTIILIGSGPYSAEDVANAKRQNPLTLYLGSTLHDDVLTGQLFPSIIIAADGAGQFGSTASAQVWQVHAKACLDAGSHLIVTETLGPIAQYIFAKYLDQIHVVPIGERTDRLWITGRSRPLGNVLTTLALPVAAVILKSGVIQTLGVSLTEETNNAHWKHGAQDAMAHTALDMLIHEPGSILPNPNYRLIHFAHLSEMTSSLADLDISIANAETPKPGKFRLEHPRVTAKQRLLAGVVRRLDYAKPAVHVGVVMSFVLISTSLIGFLNGLLTPATAALGLSMAAILGSASLGLFLRLRVKRWTLMFERRRRQIEAAELAAIKTRLDTLESKLDQ